MRILLVTALAGMLFASCSSGPSKEEQAAIEKEVIENESAAAAAEKAKAEIKETASKVDSLINEL